MVTESLHGITTASAAYLAGELSAAEYRHRLELMVSQLDDKGLEQLALQIDELND